MVRPHLLTLLAITSLAGCVAEEDEAASAVQVDDSAMTPQGETASADIAANDLGPDNMQKKYVTNFKWTGAKATVGMGMGK